MKTLSNITELRQQIKQWRMQGERIAFVPTMGNLHAGHLSLVEKAKSVADRVVVSIFVNPMQFGAGEDLDNYPKTLDADSQALDAHEVDLLFTPTAELIYPKGLDNQTFVEVPDISDLLCGESRPGHFRGVATVVCKLFNLVQADVACFGEKDFQQLMVIRTMVEDLNIPIDIIGVPTMREASGLAMSSRNGYLSEEEKHQAALLSRVIKATSDALQAGNTDIQGLIDDANGKLAQGGFKPDYFAIRCARTLAPVSDVHKDLVILAAAYMGSARLIDNRTLSR